MFMPSDHQVDRIDGAVWIVRIDFVVCMGRGMLCASIWERANVIARYLL